MLDALVHVTDLLAAPCALLAYLGALAAGMLMVTGADHHLVGRRLAHLSTGHHELEVLWLDVLAADLQAMVHRHAQAGCVAPQARLDACAHLGGQVFHGKASCF
ncbi:MAG: hypothetical protein ACRYHQ_02755 [Janthinobacterium lividum]